MPISEHRISGLDGLRGTAILLVLLFHFGLAFRPGNAAEKYLSLLLPLGSSGVDLFFVLSGFLITGILLRTKSSPDYFRSFYGRRIIRIFPLYYLLLGAMFWIVPSLWPVDVAGQPWYWLFLSNWKSAYGAEVFGLSASWSLAVEEQFYLAWPLIIFFTPTKHLRILCVAMIVGAPLLRLPFAMNPPHPEFLHRLTPFRIDALAMGAFIALAAHLGAALRTVRCSAVFFSGIAGVLALRYVFSSQLFAIHVIDFRPSLGVIVATIEPSLFAISYGALVVACVTGRSSALQSIMNGRFLHAFGKYSYSIYLFHFVLIVSIDWLPSGIIGLIAREALMIGLAYLIGLMSWNLIEKRLLPLRKWFLYSEARPLQTETPDLVLVR